MRHQRCLPACKSADVPKIYLHESIIWPQNAAHVSPESFRSFWKGQNPHVLNPKMSQPQLAAKLKSDQCILALVKWYSYASDADFSYYWFITSVFIERQSRNNYCKCLWPTGERICGRRTALDAAASSVDKVNNAAVRMNLSCPVEKSI